MAIASAGLQTLVGRMQKSGAKVTENDLKKAEIVNVEENVWPVGTKTVGMEKLTESELRERMFKRTEIRGRQLDNPIYGICLETNKGPKVLYVNSLTKTLVPYVLEDGIPVQSDEEPKHSSSEVYEAAKKCSTVNEIVQKVFLNHNITAVSQSEKVRVARFDQDGNVVGVKPGTYTNFEFA
jgi:hypothetical protein